MFQGSPKGVYRYSVFRVVVCLFAFSCTLPAYALNASEKLPENIIDELDTQLNTDIEEEFILKDIEKVKVDKSLLDKPWQPVPFNQRPFSLNRQQLKLAWPHQMRAIRLPFPTADYLRARFEAFPELKAEIPGFDEDYELLAAHIQQVWIYFIRGDFELARKEGKQFGLYGNIPGLLSQIIHAMYLTDSQAEKEMLLQDALDEVARYSKQLKAMKQSDEFKQDYAVIRIGHAYALSRIAEEVSVPTGIRRNYLIHLKSAIKDVLTIDPQHPVGLSLRAGVDANLIRILGKGLSRVAFGSSHNVSEDYFLKSFEVVNDFPVIRTEYANSLLYRYKTRRINDAIYNLEKAANMVPQNAMEKLDTLYARKRLQEVLALKKSRRGFRTFDRNRNKYRKKTGENLFAINSPYFDMSKKYRYVRH